MPLDEASPVRDTRLPDPGVPLPEWDFAWSDYDKVPIEREYLARGTVVLRLPVVFGEHDYLVREEGVLRRLRARRRRIPVGPANLLFTRGYVGDVASASRLAIEAGGRGQIYNVGESRTASIGLWMRRIAEAAGTDVELVRVPEQAIPPDLRLSGTFSQHLLVDSSKSRAELGVRETDPDEALRRSVGWHVAHPPAGGAGDFAADDAALAST